jgi:hypothetical protein
VDVAPLLDVQEFLRQIKVKLAASWVQNGKKTARKNETLIFLLSTLALPYSPPQDGDMSKLTPETFIRKENDHELDYFNRLINPVLKNNLQICLNGLELSQFEQMQAHALELLEENFTVPLPLAAVSEDPNGMDFYPASRFLQSINSTVHRRVRLEMIPIENKLMSLLDFGGTTHASFDRTIKEIMACNSLLDQVNSARHDYVLADRLRSGIRKQSSSLINKDPVAYNYINNALAEARTLGSFTDVVACLSPAYVSIDAERQPAPTEHAFVASTHHKPKRPQAPKSPADKKTSSIIKDLQNRLDQSQATISRLRRENEAMTSLARTLGAKCDDVAEAVYAAHEAHLSKIHHPAQEAHLSKALRHSPRRHSPRREERPSQTIAPRLPSSSDSEEDYAPPTLQQVAFTACPMTGPLQASIPLPAQPLIDSDRALHFTQAALALPPSAAQLRDYFLLQAQAVALRAAPAPAVGSPEPVQAPLHTTCQPIADLANLNAVFRPSSPYYCRELQTSYDTPTPSPPRQRTSPRTYLEAAQGRTPERTRGPGREGYST